MKTFHFQKSPSSKNEKILFSPYYIAAGETRGLGGRKEPTAEPYTAFHKAFVSEPVAEALR